MINKEKLNLFKVLIYGDLKGYVAAENPYKAYRKVALMKKYKSMLWYENGKPTNLTFEKSQEVLK